MSDKKALKEQYKQYKPDMGIVSYKCLATGKVYLAISQNIKADINSLTFQLNLGNYPLCANLVGDWKKYGQTGFEISTIEQLDYDKDESKTDYTADLKLLREICAEKISDFEFIK